jgi:hypothetical protein
MKGSTGYKSSYSANMDRQAVLLGMCAVLFFSKLVVIANFGSQCPYFDQWDAECGFIYPRYLNGKLKLSDFFALHNEHMIFFTKIKSLLLLELMGGMDTVAQMVFNSALHVAALAILIHYTTRPLSDKAFGFAVFFFTLFLAIPVGWENILQAIQSVIYFGMIFSLFSLKMSLESAFPSKKWMMGVFLGLCASSNTASGSIVFAVLFGFSVLRLISSGEKRLLTGAESLIHLTLFLLILKSIPQYKHHVSLKAHSIGEFLAACSMILSWPLKQSHWHALAMWAPTGLLALKLLKKDLPRIDGAYLTLGISTWVMASGLVLAYGRANGLLPSRYLDMVSLGIITNSVAALILLERKRMDRVGAIFAIVFLGYSCWTGLQPGERYREMKEGIQWRYEFGKKNEVNITGFVKYGDSSYLAGKKPFELPYPDSSRLADLLSRPIVRGMLPSEYGTTEAERRMVREKTFLKGRLSGFALSVKENLLKASSFLLYASTFLYLLLLYRFFRSLGHAQTG